MSGPEQHGLGDTPTASLAAAVANSEEGVAVLTLPASLGAEHVLLALLDLKEAFANEVAYRPDLRLAFVTGQELDRPQLAAIAVCWSGDDVPGVVLDLGAPIFGAGDTEEES